MVFVCYNFTPFSSFVNAIDIFMFFFVRFRYSIVVGVRLVRTSYFIQFFLIYCSIFVLIAGSGNLTFPWLDVTISIIIDQCYLYKYNKNGKYRLSANEDVSHFVWGILVVIFTLKSDKEVYQLSMSNRIVTHPILGELEPGSSVTIYFNGEPISARKGEMVAAALYNAGVRSFRYTPKMNEPRGIFCAIGRCTDCMMIVDGLPNTRTCITPVHEGMRVETQHGLG